MNTRQRVLIVSSHPLFSEGIKRLLEARPEADTKVFGVVASVDEAMQKLEKSEADLVVVDHDDDAVNQEEFLSRFVEGKKRLRVVLLSLLEGGNTAIVYDRRTMASASINDWLNEWSENFTGSEMVLTNRNATTTNDVMKKGSLGMKHTIGVLFFVAIFTVLGLFFLRTDNLLPTGASVQAGPIDWLFSLHFRLIAVLFALIVGTLVYSLIFFRRKRGELDDPVYEKGDPSLNINFVIFPMAAVLAYVLFESIEFFERIYTQILPTTVLSFGAVAAAAAALMGGIVYLMIFPPFRKGNLHEETAKENSRLELAWIAIPLGIVLAFAIIGSDALAQTQRMDPNALEVRVIGQQWSWTFEYKDLGITSTDLVLPVDQQVLLMLTSVDVIHSFWVPEFRVKQDALPGMERELRVTPNQTGDFSLICAEMCGKQHAYMAAPVQVLSAEGFTAWVDGQLASVSDDPVVRGQVWYNQFGCAACHTLDGTPLVGPSFQGLLGREEVFEDGTSLVVDEVYIYESITNPAAKIVKGFPNAMPANFVERMTEEQIQDIIEFLKTLR